MDDQLLAAAAAGDVAAITAALDGGANVDARDATGRTALLAATMAGRIDAVRALLEAGADVDLQDDRQDNPFLYAGAEGMLDILRLVNEAGADPTLTNRFGGTALIPASERGHVEVVRYLLNETDVDVDHVNRLGWTALLEAIVLGDGDAAHQEVVDLLIENGADVDLADKDGVRPLHPRPEPRSDGDRPGARGGRRPTLMPAATASIAAARAGQAMWSRVRLRRRRRAEQLERELELLAQDRERPLHAGLTARRERPQDRPADEHAARAERAARSRRRGRAGRRRRPRPRSRPATAATISSSTSIAAGDRSSWRPPWFETTIASTPCSTARRASSPVRIPLRTSGSGDHDRIVGERVPGQVLRDPLVDGLERAVRVAAWRRASAGRPEVAVRDVERSPTAGRARGSRAPAGRR